MEQRNRIIVVGFEGTGKSQVAELIAAGSGLPIVEEWNGDSSLPLQCVAVTNAFHPESARELSLVHRAVVVVAYCAVKPPVLPDPVAEVTVTGVVGDFDDSVSAVA